MAINEIEILAEALDEGEEVEFQRDPEQFRVDSLDKLDWAIRKWVRVDRDAQQKVDCAKRQIERLQSYIRDVEEKAERQKVSLEVMMEPFVRQLLDGGKSKTYKAPSGNVSIRKQPPEISRDDEMLVRFLHNTGRDDLVKVVEKPDWATFKKLLNTQVREDGTVFFVTPEGELVEGAVGMVRPDKVIVETL